MRYVSFVIGESITTRLKIKIPKGGFHSDTTEETFWVPQKKNLSVTR